MNTTTPTPPRAAVPERMRLACTRSLRWLHKNLFNTWYNTLLSLLVLWLAWVTLPPLLRWAFLDAVWTIAPVKRESCVGATGACWAFIRDLWSLFIVGTYPYEERWRAYSALILVSVLWGLIFVPRARASRIYWIALFAAPVPVLVLVHGGIGIFSLEKVSTNLWGGLLVTVMLCIGVALFSPLGVLLALGRRSNMPMVRALCVMYIELIRGVPLITVLFMASALFPLFFPTGFEPDRLTRALIGLILFSAAYFAEVIRGGLQAIPHGQEEAAAAMGFSYWQTTGLIILPQTLRIVIPPLINTFIGLFKDTSLVTVIGMFDLLAIAALSTANPSWFGKIIEAYVFIALIYWSIFHTMGRYSSYLERRFQTTQKA